MKLHDISCTQGLIKIMPKAALFGQFVLILTLLMLYLHVLFYHFVNNSKESSDSLVAGKSNFD